jgi:hypothetical protein
MTLFHREFFTAAAGLAVAVALWPGPARAETWEIVVPPNMPRSDELKAEIWDFFLRGMGPGDGLTVHDGLYARQLARIEIPDDARFEAVRVRTKALSRETAALSRRIDALSDAAGGESGYRIAFPEFAYSYGNARTEGESHMLVITSGLHDAPLEPAFGLRRDGEALMMPNDAHVAASLSESPYGTRGREDALEGVVAHFCLMESDGPMTTYQKDELRRFWSLYVGHMGGEMATFTESLPRCFDRWRGKVRGDMPEEVLDARTEVIAMRRVLRSPSGDGNPRPRPRPRPGQAEGIEDFALFSSRPHPMLEGVEVTTGVKYRADEYPRTYVSAWCYTSIEHKGVTIRIEVGAKFPLGDVDWHFATTDELAAAGISAVEAEAGRSACGFPEDAT